MVFKKINGEHRDYIILFFLWRKHILKTQKLLVFSHIWVTFYFMSKTVVEPKHTITKIKELGE